MALIISCLFSEKTFADSPQLSFGDSLSVYSDKAYRKNQGKYFEAVGNVVIISKTDTIYGEVASLDQEKMLVKIEGNVRIITKDMTLYGSHLEYHLDSGFARIKNARIVNSDFNLIASELIRFNEVDYSAYQAEFTTCKDCPESWSVFGKEIKLKMKETVTIWHGLFRVRGASVVYLPYLVMPFMVKRKTGLLFPKISNRLGEGLALEVPVFIAIGDSKDATITPTFWAKRGYGGDVQYRQKFNKLSWLETNNRVINDAIYQPGRKNQGPSGENFFRYFTEIETQYHFTSNLTTHLRYTGVRDLDMIQDNSQYSDPKIIGSDIGFSGYLDYRREHFSASVESQYLRNQLIQDSLEFDRKYVQTLPKLNFSVQPHSLYQSHYPLLEHISVGLDSSLSRFRQVDKDDSGNLRNFDRLSTRPYINWNLATFGPFQVKTQYTFDQQNYRFDSKNEHSFTKNAGLVKSEISFSMDKIFGLAFEEPIPVKYLSKAELRKLADNKSKDIKPLKREESENKLIGQMPKFEKEFVSETVVQRRNSYRHSQDFKLIHHFISSSSEFGNNRFLNQIDSKQQGWADFEDALRRQEYLFGINSTRTLIPPVNTAELQWNNTLIRKSPKKFNYLEDNKYLRDNFTYSKVAYINLSQGYLLNQTNSNDLRERLTRLALETGFNGDRWSIGLQEYYFHRESKNIFNVNFTRRFDLLNLFAFYNYNSFSSPLLNTLAIGGQVRPIDTIGLSAFKDLDLNNRKSELRTVYSLDLMPNNNCWILNLNYRKTTADSRFSFNILFNFGDDNFSEFKTNYFSIKRL